MSLLGVFSSSHLSLTFESNSLLNFPPLTSILINSNTHTHKFKKTAHSKCVTFTAGGFEIMTQMSSRMNATQMIQSSSRTPIFNFGVLLLTSRYVASHYLSTKFKNKIKRIVAEMSGESTFLRHVLGSVIWGSVTIPILLPFDCARTRFVAGRKGLGLKLNRSSVISVLLGVTGVCVYRILSYLLYGASKTILKGRSATTRFLMEFLINSVAGTVTYPIDTLRRMYFLESHVTKGLTTNMLLRGVWIEWLDKACSSWENSFTNKRGAHSTRLRIQLVIVDRLLLPRVHHRRTKISQHQETNALGVVEVVVLLRLSDDRVYFFLKFHLINFMALNYITNQKLILKYKTPTHSF